jgi:hypothetical protein
MQEMYELIRREMIEMADARDSHTQCIMLQERGAPWSAKAGANDSVERCLWRDGCGEWEYSQPNEYSH